VNKGYVQLINDIQELGITIDALLRQLISSYDNYLNTTNNYSTLPEVDELENYFSLREK
jgi:hypothetical protein